QSTGGVFSALCITCCLLLGLVLIVGILALTSTAKKSDVDDDATEDLRIYKTGGGGGGGRVDVPPTAVGGGSTSSDATQSALPLTVSVVTPAPTPSTTPTTSTFTTPPMPTTPSTTTTTQRPLDPNSMICTLGESFNRSSLGFPDDGICTLIFFDSLYTAGGVTLAPPYPDNFQYFLEGSRKYTKTESGIGFDYEKRKDVSALVGDPATKTQLDALWQSRVYHYGHLNTPPFMVSASDQVELLTSLQLIAGLMENLRDKNTRPVYKVLVFAFPDTTWARETVERLRYMPVDILIGVSHQTVDDKSFADCTILPPTFMDSPGGSYPYSLVRIIR
ncbi:hypothetical protein MTO96_034047, partial [Rhipicephalus appendiculatus]